MTLTSVRVADCSCPDTPHDGHHVFLAPTLDLDGGIRAEQAIFASKGDLDELMRLWLPIFVRYGAKDWDLCDEAGEPRPFDVEAILSDFAIARPVADKAADLYRDTVLAPFRTARQPRSPTTPTTPTTSRRATRSRKSSASQ
jgi:hypothetical protein